MHAYADLPDTATSPTASPLPPVRLTDGGRFLAGAGVVTEWQPGRYALATTAAPDWDAAAAVLSSTNPGGVAA
ncbi:hypothetical protein [Streptomyces sp. NPDC057403]|uniref:hypothetical protein n=1 Tax=Streptomyces sp. NPDC057403 TaxID=3346119 RepID=UPI003692B9BF